MTKFTPKVGGTHHLGYSFIRKQFWSWEDRKGEMAFPTVVL
jgi:hypothetical protein